MHLWKYRNFQNEAKLEQMIVMKAQNTVSISQQKKALVRYDSYLTKILQLKFFYLQHWSQYLPKNLLLKE